MTAEQTRIKELEEEQRRLKEEVRRETKQRFFAVTGRRGSMISPELAGAFLEVSYRQIYRWLADDIWLPKYEFCASINNFLDTVESLRKSWPEFIRIWKDAKLAKRLPTSLKMAAFAPSILRVLEDGSLNDSEKSEELTIRSLRVIKARMEEEQKEKSDEQNS